MSGTLAEAKVRKMPWITIVVFSAVLSSIISITEAFTLPTAVARSIYTLGPAPCAVCFPIASFAFLLVLPLLRKVEYLRNKIDNEMMTYLYVAAICVSWTSGQMFWTEMGPIFSDRILNPAISTRDIPLIMAPLESTITPYITGGVSVPWGDWVPAIFWWSARNIAIVLLMVSLSAILRRSWIEVERLPFQQSIMAYELAKVSMGGRSELLKSKPFTIGILLGIAFQLPIFLKYIFPWFPDIYGWTVNTCGTGAWYVPTDSGLLSIIGLSNIQKNPATYGLMFLAPLKVLLSTWVWYAIYVILIQVAWIQGYYTGMDTVSGCCRGYSGANTPLWAPPYKFMALSFAGGFTGLAIINLYANRQYLSQTLKAAMNRLGPGSPLREIEMNEPLKYRQAWSLFALSFFLNIIVYAVTGVSIYSAFILTVGLLIMWIGMARLAGMTGINSTESVDHGNAFLRLFVWPQAPEPPTSDYMLSSSAVQWASQPYSPAYGFAIISAFAAFKFSSLSGADNRNVFKTLIVALSVGFVSCFITILALNYAFGAQKLSFSWALMTDTDFRGRTADPGRWNGRPGSEPLAPYVLGGALIVSALYLLSARFVWFPLEPVGFILGTSMLGAGLVGLWAPALVCWVLKTLILRIGGSKLYEERAVPLISGFVAGYALITVVAVLVFVVRFFYPF